MTESESPGHTRQGPVSKRVQAVELGVFLLLILPSLVLGAVLHAPRSAGFTATAATTMAQDLGLVALVLFFVWRSGESLRSIGWSFGAGLREVLVGLVFFWPTAVATSVLAGWLERLGLSGGAGSPTFLTPAGPWQMALGLGLVAVVAVAEETIFRGYLLLRLAPFLRSTGAAVAVSSVIFALGHGYEGGAGMISVGTLGALYAVVYLWRQSLVAPIVMHFMQDLIGVVFSSGMR